MSRTRRLAAALMVAVGAGWMGNALSQGQVHEIKVSLFTPASNDINLAFEAMAKTLEQKSGGRLKFNMFHASQLGPPPRQFDLVRTGVADLTYHLHGLTPGRFPLSELIELPGVITTGMAGTAAMVELMNEYLLAEHQGTRLLGFLIAPPAVLMTTRAEMRTIADFKGKRIRHPGPIQSATLSALGAAPVAVQPAELHDSLAKGVVDGAITGFTGATAFKLIEIVRYVTDMNLGTITFAIVMNPATYDKLPADLKALIDGFSGTAGVPHWGPQFDIAEARNREGFVKGGIRFNRLDAKEQAAFDAIAVKLQESTVADMEKKGLPARAYFTKLRAAIARHTK